MSQELQTIFSRVLICFVYCNLPYSQKKSYTSTLIILQNSSPAEPSVHSLPDKETKNGSEAWDGKVDLWKPLNCLVEVANRSKSSKFSSQGCAATKSDPLHSAENEGHARKNKMKEHIQKAKIQDEKNTNETAPQESERPKKLRRIRQKKAPALGEFNVPPQLLLEGVNGRCEKRFNPIWFSLVASKDR